MSKTDLSATTPPPPPSTVTSTVKVTSNNNQPNSSESFQLSLPQDPAVAVELPIDQEFENELQETNDAIATANAKTSSTIQAIGTLNVSSAITTDSFGAVPSPPKTSTAILPSKTNLKKPASKATKISTVKKLTVGTSDAVIESFEAQERRLAHQAKQQEKNAALNPNVIKYSNEDNNGNTSRVNAIYNEVASSSATNPSPAAAQLLSPSKYQAPPTNSTKTSTSNSTSSESYAAREKYTNAKSISSDQYFGDPNAEHAHNMEVRNKLQSLSHSSGISSDMFSSSAGSPNGRDYVSNDTSNNTATSSLGRWTSDIIKRIG